MSEGCMADSETGEKGFLSPDVTGGCGPGGGGGFYFSKFVVVVVCTVPCFVPESLEERLVEGFEIKGRGLDRIGYFWQPGRLLCRLVD